MRAQAWGRGGRGRAHGGSLPDPAAQASQAARDEAVGPRLEPARLAREPLGGGVPRPVRGQQLGGQPGVGEEELAPLVHEVEADGERRLVRVGALRAAALLGDQDVGGLGPAGVGVVQGGEVPGLGRRRVEVRGRGRSGRSRRPASRTEGSSGRANGLTQTWSASSAYPTKARSARSRWRGAPARRRLEEERGARRRPRETGPAGRSARPPGRGGRWRARWPGSRGRRRAGPAPASPASPSGRSRCSPRGAAMPTGASRRTTAATGAWLPRVRRWSP